MDAWDLVMRALSHFWRVTRQNNIVAQALLERAVAIDPNYGRALGMLATSHSFCGHMGWEDIASVAPIAERAALAAIVADSEDPWAHLEHFRLDVNRNSNRGFPPACKSDSGCSDSNGGVARWPGDIRTT
jgi:hypothetical protein